jgi:hypothetical protein
MVIIAEVSGLSIRRLTKVNKNLQICVSELTKKISGLAISGLRKKASALLW